MKKKEVVGLIDIKASIFKVAEKNDRETISVFGKELCTLDKHIKLRAIIGNNIITDKGEYNINILAPDGHFIIDIMIKPETARHFSEYCHERLAVFSTRNSIMLAKHKCEVDYEYVKCATIKNMEGSIKTIRLINISSTLVSIMILDDNSNIYISTPTSTYHRNAIKFTKINLDHKDITEFTINVIKIKPRKKGGFNTTVELCYMVKTDEPKVGKLYVSTIKHKINKDELGGKSVITAPKLVEDYDGPYKNIRLF